MRRSEDDFISSPWTRANGESVAREDLALLLAERYAELISSVVLECEAGGEPLSERQRSILRAVGAKLLRESR
jgi:hypothetical protein